MEANDPVKPESTKTIKLHIKRQDSPEAKSRYEDLCGACTMLINGVARQACSTLIDSLEQPITLAPLTKFPLVRDLKVDRQKLFEHLKRVHAWIDIDGVFDLGPGPRMSQKTRLGLRAFQMHDVRLLLRGVPQHEAR